MVWRYTTQEPAADWMKPGFDDSAWQQGRGGFGAGNVHGSPIGTAWTTPDIWIRRVVELPAELPDNLCLRMHHDEDAEVYVNGLLAAKAKGHVTGHERFAIGAAGKAALRPGKNLLAAHCHQTRGGQFIDVDIVEGRPGPVRAAARPPKKGRRPKPTPTRGPINFLKTRWAKDVTPENVWREHPRPQRMRKDWLNLNGLWDYAIEGESRPWTMGRLANAEADLIDKLDRSAPPRWDGKILVPFCVESALSGVQKLVRPNQLLWYRRSFTVPDGWADRRVLLRFEAVDWHARAWVNAKKVGDHKGGYDPFAFDVTDALAARKEGEHEVVVAVWDPTNMGDQAVGKQALPELRRGFRYTPTTGIWQTVWLEPVGRWRIEDLKLTPDVDGKRLIVELSHLRLSRSSEVHVAVLDGEKEAARARGRNRIEVPIAKPRLWSPDDPFLYTVRVTLRRILDAKTVDDEITSYVGMRKVSLAKDAAGFTRICLNDKPLFQIGPLDQGYWPDGILAPASDAALAFDVEFLKRIACNMSRVHVKVHPERFYYHCDRLGILVWQDMVCTRKFSPQISKASAAQWEAEQKAMIDQLRNHPSIIMWVVFNEGWGQYDTERLTKWTKGYDPTRLANNASGWADQGVGDVLDEHDYTFHPSIPLQETSPGRAIFLGECGGFNRGIPDHNWYTQQRSPEKIDYIGAPNRMTFANAKQMDAGYAYWVDHLWQMRHAQGLNGAVYTQITDVEHELNGWLTYDREVPKLDPARIRELHLRLFRPAPKSRPIIPPSAAEPQEWKYLVGKPKGTWSAADFDDSAWKTGKGPFGKLDVKGLSVGTTWGDGAIHLRKTFTLDKLPSRVTLRLVRRKGCEVYLNGQLIKKLAGPDRNERVRAHDVPLRPATARLLRKGTNVLAVRCGDVRGPKYLDVALLEILD